MERYVEPILSALLFFPVAAGLFTLPYVIYCYRKYGSVLPMRVVCVYAFIFYLMCVYCLAILPFPGPDTVITQRSGVNLIPFSYVPEILTKPVTFSLGDPSTWGSAFFASGLYEPILNILMFLPLGVFLRYYFGWGKRRTVLCAFGLSLFLEVTQLTATYGLAPFPYRLADVNDLIHNTLGGFLGYLVTPALTFMLPTRARLNQLSYQRGQRVSYLRRLLALAADLMLMAPIVLLLELALPAALVRTAVGLAYGGLLPFLWQGRTPGKALVRIRVVDDRTHSRASLRQYLLRALLLYVIYLQGGVTLAPLLGDAVSGLVSFICLMAAFFSSAWRAIRNRPQMYYEQWTHTLETSSVEARMPKKEAEG